VLAILTMLSFVFVISVSFSLLFELVSVFVVVSVVLFVVLSVVTETPLFLKTVQEQPQQTCVAYLSLDQYWWT